MIDYILKEAKFLIKNYDPNSALSNLDNIEKLFNLAIKVKGPIAEKYDSISSMFNFIFYFSKEFDKHQNTIQGFFNCSKQ